MTRKKLIQEKSDNKFKMLKELRVVLCNIASDIKTIPLHQRYLFKKQRCSEKKQLPLRIDKVQIKASAINRKKPTVTNSLKISKKKIKKEDEKEYSRVIKSVEVNGTDTKLNRDKYDAIYSRPIAWESNVEISDGSESIFSPSSEMFSTTEDFARDMTQNILYPVEVDNIKKSPLILPTSLYYTNNIKKVTVSKKHFKQYSNKKLYTIKTKDELNFNEDVLNSTEVNGKFFIYLYIFLCNMY